MSRRDLSSPPLISSLICPCPVDGRPTDPEGKGECTGAAVFQIDEGNQDGIDFLRTQSICVIAQCARSHAPANLGALFFCRLAQQAHHIFSRRGHKDLFARFKEFGDAVPFIRNETGGSARSFKDAGGRREAHIGHRITIYV